MKPVHACTLRVANRSMIACVDAALAEPRKHVCDAVVVSLGTRIGHRVGGKGDVEARLVGLPRGGLDAGAGGDAGDDDLRDAALPQLALEIGAGECAPCPLGHGDIVGLSIQLGNEIGPSVGERTARARPLGAARCAAGDIDQHDRQAMPPKRRGKRAGARHDVAHGVNGREIDDAALQVDDDERGDRVERRESHDHILPAARGGAASIVDEPLEQGDGGGQFVLLPR